MYFNNKVCAVKFNVYHLLNYFNGFSHFYLRSGHGGAGRQWGKVCVAPGNCRGVCIRGDGVTPAGGWRCKEKLRLPQVSAETNLAQTHTLIKPSCLRRGFNQVSVTH